MPEPVLPLVSLAQRDGILVIRVAAEQLSALGVADRFDRELERLLESRAESRWVVDFGAVAFLVTPVIGTLIRVNNVLREKGGRLALCGLSANIRQVLRLVRLDESVAFAADVEEAVGELGSAGP